LESKGFSDLPLEGELTWLLLSDHAVEELPSHWLLFTALVASPFASGPDVATFPGTPPLDDSEGSRGMSATEA
jgi:hypothetical protein